MGVRIIENTEDGYKALYCSTTMTAFGSIFYEDDDVEDFLEWLGTDARRLTQGELDSKI
jgi:hypothetical protein